MILQTQFDQWKTQVLGKAARGELLPVDLAMLSKLIAESTDKTEEWQQIAQLVRSRPLFRVRAVANQFLAREAVPVAIHELRNAAVWVISQE